MILSLDEQQVQTIKNQLEISNRKSHFVIIEANAQGQDDDVKLVTDYDNFVKMRDMNGQNFKFRIIRDIVPITDNLAYWAVAQESLHEASEKGTPDDNLVNDLEFYTNKVMVENKVATS